MGIEEKAKAYDEAINQAKKELQTCGSLNCDAARQIFRLFPKLAESEDKKIIEEIKFAVLQMPSEREDTKQRCLAWLEKQKEQKPWKVGENAYFTPDKETPIAEKEQKPNYCHYGGDPNKERCKHCSAACIGRITEEQKPEGGIEYSCPDCGTTSGCTNDESEGDKRYREGIRYALQQTEDYTIGKTFKGLIPCWVNAPSELQPAHKYHGKNVVIMHENNGGFRCVCIDDKKPVTFNLPEDTLFAEGWRKPEERFEEAREKYQVEWSEEDKDYYDTIVRKLEVIGDDSGLSDNQIKFLREHCPLNCSVWSEEDEKMRSRILDIFACDQKHYLAETTWLKSLRPQPKQEWSKEDTSNLAQFIKKRAEAYEFNLPNRSYDIFGFAKDILKYFKINQEKVAWSEEDIDASVKPYSNSLPMCGEFQSYHDALVHAYRQGVVYALKSLRPSWKPSEEQMTNLLRAEGRLRIEGESVLASKLAELYEQLKRLM